MKADATETALTRLNDVIGEVMIQGAKTPPEVARAFDQLGISMADVQKHGDDLDWMLAAMAEGMKNLGTQAERTAVAKALMGKQAAALLPLLAEGAAGLDAERQAAHAAGAVLGEDLVEQLSEAGDKLAALDQALTVQSARSFGVFSDAIVETKGFVVDLWIGINDLLDVVRQQVGDNIFKEIAEWALSPLKPLQEVLGLLRAVRQYSPPPGSASTGNSMVDDLLASQGVGVPDYTTGGGFGGEPVGLPSPVARPSNITPRGSGRGGWPTSGKSGKGTKPPFVDFAGNAITPTEDELYFSAHPPKPRPVGGLDEFMDAADAIDKRNKQLMDSLQRQWLQASGERIKLIEFDRDAAIKGLDDKELSEQQHADAVVLINQTAAREIAGERVRLVDSIKSPDQLGVQSVFSLTDALKGMGVAASSAFEDAIAGGKGFSEVLQGLATDLEKLLVRKFATEPLMRLLDMGITAGGNALTQWWTGYSSHTVTADWTNLQGLKAAHGGVFEGGNVIPFARGGLIERPTIFPMARGYGLMGEAGPEAVMPLTRLPSGKLGVGSAGGPAVVNNVQIVNNHPGAKVSSEEQPNGRGGVDLTVVIDVVEQAMAQRLQRPGTTLNRALGTASNPIRAR